MNVGMIYPFRNLVLQGGGVRAFAYHGMLRVLEEKGILPQIERVGGSSAGAITAMLLSFRHDAQTTIDLFNSFDFQRVTVRENDTDAPVMEMRTRASIESRLRRVRQNANALNRLLWHYGWYSYDYPQQWLHEVIAAHCDGNPRATFREFLARGFRDLYVVVTNISRHRPEIFSAETTPDVAVADAVIMSGLIPLYFEAVQFDGQRFGRGDYYADGGVMYNYPLHIFDQARYAKNPGNFRYGVNWETLGCRLVRPQEHEEKRHEITNIMDYVQNVFEAMADAQQVIHANNPPDRLRTINIPDCGVSTTDFHIVPAKDPIYWEMVQAGEQAARAYLDDYRLPTDRFFEVKLWLADRVGSWRFGWPFS